MKTVCHKAQLLCATHSPAFSALPYPPFMAPASLIVICRISQRKCWPMNMASPTWRFHFSADWFARRRFLASKTRCAFCRQRLKPLNRRLKQAWCVRAEDLIFRESELKASKTAPSHGLTGFAAIEKAATSLHVFRKRPVK